MNLSQVVNAVIWVALFAAILPACQSDDLSVETATPQLRVVSLEPAEVQQFADSLTLTLSYTDLNGDLGSEDPDDNSLSVQDSRLAEPDFYHVPPLSPPDAEPDIEGTLVIRLPSLFLLGNGDEETVSFSVAIRDQAGNWSEAVQTPPVRVVR